jgi:hypothetical protein
MGLSRGGGFDSHAVSNATKTRMLPSNVRMKHQSMYNKERENG